MDDFIHWPELILLLSAIFDEIMSWITESWMNNYLVSGSHCNTVKLVFPQQENLQVMTNNVGLILSVGDTTLVYN